MYVYIDICFVLYSFKNFCFLIILAWWYYFNVIWIFVLCILFFLAVTETYLFHHWYCLCVIVAILYSIVIKKKKWILVLLWRYSVNWLIVNSTVCVWFHFHDTSGMDKSIETESRLAVSREWREWGLTANW